MLVEMFLSFLNLNKKNIKLFIFNLFFKITLFSIFLTI